MSKIQVNEIVNHFDNGAPDCPRGLTVTGVSTFSGNVSIGGTLSYEDVTNIDSVGIITARDGLDTPTDLVLRTGGSERLRITSAGITSVTGSLEVNGNNYPTTGALSNRNRFINGSMEVAQRGTSSTANGYVALDRWFVNQSGGSTTFSQETFTVGEERGGLQNYAKLAVSTSSDYTGIRQRIENVKSIPSGSVTISFDAKGTAPTGDLTVWMAQTFGSGGSSEVAVGQQTVTLTSSWQRFSLTFTIPSLSGKTIGSGSFLNVVIGQYSNTSTTAWELDITGVQLEVGTKATPFEHRSYSEELALCQRYFQIIATGDQASICLVYTGSAAALGPVFLPVTMRTTPTLYDATSGVIRYRLNSASANVNSGTAAVLNSTITSPTQAFLEFSFSGLVAGESAHVRKQGSTAVIGVIAEL